MAKGDYYFPLYYQRLLTSTIGWEDDEFGAYLRLLIYQFDNGSIPSDLKMIKKISKKAGKNWDFFSQKFIADGNGGLINPVMTDIRNEINNKKETNRLNGSKGGKRRAEIIPNANRTLSERVSEKQAIPITNNQEPITKEREREDSPPPIWTIEHCLTVAMNDDRWVRANKVSKADLEEFNRMLEKRGVYEKNGMDYKKHFANWKATGKKEDQQVIKKDGPKLSSIVKEIENGLNKH